MALHFDDDEFAARKGRLLAAMAEDKLDAMLLFAQESMYWLTGYDTFGFCFFQCMIVEKNGDVALLTRSADLRQARHTSNVETIVVWEDRSHANPAKDLKELLADRDLVGARIGVEYDSAGLNAHYGRLLDDQLASFADMRDASRLVSRLRAVKSAAEIACVRKAAELADDAFDAAMKKVRAGADEAAILAALQGHILAKGGDYPGNEFIIGSGRDALLCRYKSGRRTLDENDQLTLEWAGAWRRYHAALMRTVIIGKPTDRHVEMHAAASAALEAVEGAMRPGSTFGDVFDAHAHALEDAGMTRHRLNACGYSLGAHFTPCWMDRPMFYAGNPETVAENMTLFAHMIVMDSDSGTAMTLGRTYLTTEGAPEPLSRLGLDLTVA
ncbi:aminopeptidase P family protein [Oceaniradius stylonematis]|uniref:Aminopeptidase P family protein n=1 Tax=Oceaniradius stylonematis TaxID=2184161 RepID=A0A3A8A7N9_9HYPH|nr:Xaa-Pro peptidase family protein [Oceaniradius stylonematis]RKF05866.1 aminopeptidase P family protein [Oceaniradius stylonematis]